METIKYDEEILRWAQIGKILGSIGINTVENAERLKEHLTECPGGMKCIEKLLSANDDK